MSVQRIKASLIGGASRGTYSERWFISGSVVSSLDHISNNDWHNKATYIEEMIQPLGKGILCGLMLSHVLG